MSFAEAGDVDRGDVDDLRKLVDADLAIDHDAIQTGDDGHGNTFLNEFMIVNIIERLAIKRERKT